MTDLSHAAADLVWLAHQPTSAWRGHAATAEDVVTICETVREVRLEVELELHGTEPLLPSSLSVRSAARSLGWCNTIGAHGVRLPAAVSSMRAKGWTEEAGQLEHSVTVLCELTTGVRVRLGADPALLTRDQAHIVEANLGLVRWAVSRWGSNLPEHGGLYSREDAYQDAVIGLMRAVRGFDPDRGFKLATFAYAYLYSAITQGEGRARGLEYRTSKSAGTPHVPPISLDRETTRYNFHDLIPDRTAGDGLDLAEWASTAETLLDARSRVCRTERELRIFDAVAGLGDGEYRSAAFRDLGEEWGVSHEVVRSLWSDMRPRLAEALEHLRAS